MVMLLIPSIRIKSGVAFGRRYSNGEKNGEKDMANLSTIGLGIGVLVAIVSAFVSIPELALIMLIVGAVSGWGTPLDRRAGLMLTALVLTGLSGELNAIPGVGGYLASIFGTLGIGAVGASIIVICQAIAGRLMGMAGSSD